MTLLAACSAQLLNQANIARSVRISQATAHRYINVLEISGLFVKLRPYSKNITKRVVKSPKIYCLDTGLMGCLLGITEQDQIEASLRGQLFETLVFQNLLAAASILDGRLYYLRKQGGLEREIDFLFEVKGRIITIEVKASERVSLRDAENMVNLREMLPRWDAGIVLYNGTDMKKLRKDVWAIPCAMV